MRDRERVLQSLEKVYRSAFVVAEEAGDASTMARLDLEYQRDQLQLEVLLDIREILTPAQPDQTTSLLEKAQKIRRLTKLRP
jgi:protein-L-isoaspartate O-methyltransferase